MLGNHVDQCDERQPDQRVGILAVHAGDKSDAQPLGLGAAGAVIGLFLLQVTLDDGIV